MNAEDAEQTRRAALGRFTMRQIKWFLTACNVFPEVKSSVLKIKSDAVEWMMGHWGRLERHLPATLATKEDNVEALRRDKILQENAGQIKLMEKQLKILDPKKKWTIVDLTALIAQMLDHAGSGTLTPPTREEKRSRGLLLFYLSRHISEVNAAYGISITADGAGPVQTWSGSGLEQQPLADSDSKSDDFWLDLSFDQDDDSFYDGV